MTVNEYKQQNPGKMFYLKGTRGHIFHPIAKDGLIPVVYESNIIRIGTMKLSKITCLEVDYDFRK